MTKRGNQKGRQAQKYTDKQKHRYRNTNCKRTPIMITQTDGHAHVGGSTAVKNT